MPDTRNSSFNRTMNLKECREVCLRNCSCSAYGNLDIRNGGSGCLLWFGDLIDIRAFADNHIDLYVKMASSDTVQHHGKKTIVAATLAWLFHKEGRSLELVDENLRDSCYISEIMRTIHVGLLCVQESPDKRPSMSSVVMMLGSEVELAQPKHPGFFTGRTLPGSDASSSKGAMSSANQITISLLDAR
ncbi:unnamed protein product [Thlaspi arvense]|uniref:Apple domain-containing protein n=1 Tax=Thlaspi arvense TaxID=13288 RepID=A0AAU9S881_THLAR|nr:unnamed protein product [Thlaspi arvense]